MPGLLRKVVGWCAVVVFGGMLAAPANAQRVVCSKAMRSSTCDMLAAPVELELKLLNARPDWNWVILDNKEWRRAVRTYNVEGRTNKAFTLLELRTTFLCGDFLQEHRPRPTLYILAHEMGHYRCACASEKEANRIAEQMMLAAARRQQND